MKFYKNLKRLIFLVGLYKVSSPFASFIFSFYNNYYREQHFDLSNSQRLQQQYGGDQAYVAITGSSDGMGRVQALQMAKYGFNVILLSRSQAKLDQVASECRALNPSIQVKTIPIDFSTAQPQDYKSAFDQINDVNLRILINNVGVNDKVKFLELPPEKIENIIKVNLFSQVFMTKYALHYFREHKLNRSAIVHFSSFVGDNTLPFHCEYGASKRFNKVFGLITDFSNNMRKSRSNNVDTLIVKPAGVITGMNNYYSDPSFVQPEKVVQGEFRELGLQKETNGALVHSIMGLSMKYLPDFILHPAKQQIGQLDKAPYE